LRLFSIERPFAFYGGISVVLAITSLALAVPVMQTYVETGLVPRFPTAILSTGLMLMSALSFFAGLILATVTQGRRELRALFYLQQQPRAASSGYSLLSMSASAPTDQLSASARAPSYEARVGAETAIFAEQIDVHELPSIFHYWSNKYLRPIQESFGFSNPDEFFANYLARAFSHRADDVAHFVSIGAGNCDSEVRMARALKQRGIEDFIIECIDINTAMLDRGRRLAYEAGVQEQVIPLQGDFNSWRSPKRYDAVIANQSLHHVLELERLFDAIHAAIAPGGVFITSDMIGRNGHRRWPEALAIVREFWRELPPSYRYNVQLKRQENEYLEWDCSGESFEGIRAQDVLPLLIERFGFELFIGFANVIDPFIDRSFGHHFKVDSDWDRDFIDRVHARDEAEILSGRIKTTHMLAALRADPVASTQCWRHLTPAFCVRKAD
jgi:SAM-dependent methyltransferase